MIQPGAIVQAIHELAFPRHFIHGKDISVLHKPLLFGDFLYIFIA